MKTTITALMIMGALIQGTAVFATGNPYQVNFAPVGNSTTTYTIQGQGTPCNNAITNGKGHVVCNVLDATAFKRFNVTISANNHLICSLKGDISGKGDRALVPSGACDYSLIDFRGQMQQKDPITIYLK